MLIVANPQQGETGSVQPVYWIPITIDEMMRRMSLSNPSANPGSPNDTPSPLPASYFHPGPIPTVPVRAPVPIPVTVSVLSSAGDPAIDSHIWENVDGTPSYLYRPPAHIMFPQLPHWSMPRYAPSAPVPNWFHQLYEYILDHNPDAHQFYPNLEADLAVLRSSLTTNVKSSKDILNGLINLLVNRTPYEISVLQSVYKTSLGEHIPIQRIFAGMDNYVATVITGLALGPENFDIWLISTAYVVLFRHLVNSRPMPARTF
jgi:hypothetical protein